MRRILFTIWTIMLCCTMALAAETINVRYQGAKPTISDFVTSYIAEEDDLGEALGSFANTWELRQAGKGLPEDVTLTVDMKNGYIRYESRYEDFLQVIEMCYWNESDQKHKLFAYNIVSYQNGKPIVGQYDGICFYRYNNATRKMAVDYDVNNVFNYTEDGAEITYSLPKTGKNIIATTWYATGKKEKVLKWNGHGFAKP